MPLINPVNVTFALVDSPINALMVLAVFSTLACGSAECEGGGCRDKIKSHGKARGR